TFPLPHTEFDQLWADRVFSERIDVWKNALEKTDQLLADPSPLSIALCATKPTMDLDRALDISEDYIDTLDHQPRRQLELITIEGDPDELTERLTHALQKLAEIETDGDK